MSYANLKQNTERLLFSLVIHSYCIYWDTYKGRLFLLILFRHWRAIRKWQIDTQKKNNLYVLSTCTTVTISVYIFKCTFVFFLIPGVLVWVAKSDKGNNSTIVPHDAHLRLSLIYIITWLMYSISKNWLWK